MWHANYATLLLSRNFSTPAYQRRTDKILCIEHFPSKNSSHFHYSCENENFPCDNSAAPQTLQFIIFFGYNSYVCLLPGPTGERDQIDRVDVYTYTYIPVYVLTFFRRSAFGLFNVTEFVTDLRKLPNNLPLRDEKILQFIENFFLLIYVLLFACLSFPKLRGLFFKFAKLAKYDYLLKFTFFMEFSREFYYQISSIFIKIDSV